MNTSISKAIEFLVESRDVPADDTQAAVNAMMDGQCNDLEIAAFLTALRVKGESVEEIVGAATAMQQHAARIETTRAGLLDTCGTGGDGLLTFNISTATAFVAAACGVPVAKHGNRSVSSSSGSADVLEALGVNIQLSPDQVGRSLDELGIGFCFAPVFHGAMKYAAPVRKQLGFRTIFNLVGPLANPARAEYQLLGANRFETAEKLANALARLGRRRALVVCGADELDEVCLWGETNVFEVTGESVRQFFWTAASFGVSACHVKSLQVESAGESASMIHDVFSGKLGPARDIVVANTAAALLATGQITDTNTGAEAAANAIDSGSATELLSRLVEFSTTI